MARPEGAAPAAASLQRYNRRYIEDYLPRELELSVRTRQPLTILMVDLDRFKDYNDTYGHIAGDEALKQLADRLVSNVRVGTRLPAHATVMGRSLLTDQTLEELRTRFGDNSLEAATPETATTIGELFEQVGAAKEHGFAISVAGFEAGISSVGAPVRDVSGQVVAAINVTGPVSEFSHYRLALTVVGPVCEAAAEISRRLGYRAAASPRAAE